MSFFSALLLTFVAGDVWWGWHAWRRLRMSRLRWVTVGFVLAQLGGLGLIIFARRAGHGWDEAVPRPLLSAIYLWHLIVLPLWMIVAVGSGIFSTIALAMRALRGQRRPQARQATDGMTRREFLAASATLAPAVLTAGGTLMGEAQLEQFRLRRIELPQANLPPGLDGLTIAHLSDTHVGRFTRDAVLARIVDATNALRADLVVVTGDLINVSLRDLPAAVAFVRALRGGTDVFLCEGNHDLIDDGPRFRRDARRAGLAILLGESTTITLRGTRVQILGALWARGAAGLRKQVGAVVSQRDPAAWPLLLAHHPHAFDFAAGVPLTLAGHTHGGQLMLSETVGAGPMLFRYWSGPYWRDDRALVVSNGAGNWFPIRLNAPAEIIHLTLRRAPLHAAR